MNISVPTKQIQVYVARNEKGEIKDHMIKGSKRKIPCCSYHESSKEKPMRRLRGNCKYPFTFLEKKENRKKSLESKYKEQPKTANDGTEHTVRTTDAETLQWKLLPTPLKFHRSPKKNVSPEKHTLT